MNIEHATELALFAIMLDFEIDENVPPRLIQRADPYCTEGAIRQRHVSIHNADLQCGSIWNEQVSHLVQAKNAILFVLNDSDEHAKTFTNVSNPPNLVKLNQISTPCQLTYHFTEHTIKNYMTCHDSSDLMLFNIMK